MSADPCVTAPIRAWPVHDRLPAGCIAFPVTDDTSWPLACAGEWVVLDPTQREPLEGELFVVESGRSTPTRGIGSCRRSPGRSPTPTILAPPPGGSAPVPGRAPMRRRERSPRVAAS